ncbi:MAG: bifunctional metallophosphatase/5'-nucleotidase [Candidatus Tectomicrobia bacterium]|nr:bifunctional metallophosphatase/5'-nucleotidase [Candidatus Tectomicrobia bacterium]
MRQRPAWLGMKGLSGLLAGALLLLALLLQPGIGQAPPRRLTLVHFNDFYRIEGVEGRAKGGIARLGGLLERLRGQGPALALFGGDLLSPSLMSREFGGAQMIEGLNAVGLDAATFGNHEFDSRDGGVLLARLKESRFPWVSSNVRGADGSPFPGVAPRMVREAGGVRVGILAVTLPAVRRPYVRYLPVLDSARREAETLRRAGAELVIALTHLGMEEDLDLARRLPGVDLILGGHEHDAQLGRAGAALVLKADSDLRTAWVVEATVPAQGRPEFHARLVPLGMGIPQPPALRALEEKWLARLAERLGPDEPVARSEVALDGRESTLRFREGNLGNLVADAFREEGRCEISAVNGGAIRVDELLPPGALSRHQVAEILLFRNRVVRLRVPGSALAAALDHSAAQRGSGGFLQISGMRVAFDPGAPAGRRLRGAEAGGGPLRADRLYTLCTLDFLAEGGDGYAMWAKPEYRLGGDAGDSEELLLRHLRRLGRAAPREEGRIRFQGR